VKTQIKSKTTTPTIPPYKGRWQLADGGCFSTAKPSQIFIPPYKGRCQLADG